MCTDIPVKPHKRIFPDIPVKPHIYTFLFDLCEIVLLCSNSESTRRMWYIMWIAMHNL